MSITCKQTEGTRWIVPSGASRFASPWWLIAVREELSFVRLVGQTRLRERGEYPTLTVDDGGRRCVGLDPRAKPER